MIFWHFKKIAPQKTGIMAARLEFEAKYPISVQYSNFKAYYGSLPTLKPFK